MPASSIADPRERLRAEPADDVESLLWNIRIVVAAYGDDFVTIS